MSLLKPARYSLAIKAEIQALLECLRKAKLEDFPFFFFFDR